MTTMTVVADFASKTLSKPREFAPAAGESAPAIACQYSVYNSIRDVDAREWNSVRSPRSDPFMEPGFIEAVERSMASVCRFRHVVVRDKQGLPIAAACLSSYTVDGASLAEGFAKTVLSAVGRVWPWLARNTIVMCGLPVSTGDSHLRFAPHADRASVLAILDRLVSEFAAAERARFIIFKEFNAEGCRDLGTLADLGYRQADSYPMNYAVSNYASFENYLSQVRSKKRRMLKGSIKKFAKGGFRVVTLTGREGAADLYTDQVHRLYEAVLSRSKVQFEHLPADFLRELARRLPDNTSFTYVFRGAEPVAFAASVYSETTFHGLVLGIDYDVNREHEVYFNVLFQSLDVALRRRAHDILLGQTADTTKHAKLDIYQAPISIYVKGAKRTIRAALKLAFPLFFPPRPAAYLRDPDDETDDATENG